jgi:aminoacrylate hydrolase
MRSDWAAPRKLPVRITVTNACIASKSAIGRSCGPITPTIQALVNTTERSIVLVMATFTTQGIDIHYELFGDRKKPPVVLIHGLGGSGKSWGAQVERFAADFFVVLPDQRGVGQSARAKDGYSIAQMARDTAALLADLDVGPAHLVGSSTGGVIAQVLALDHAARVRSIVLASSIACPDAYVRREFATRRKLMAEMDLESAMSAYALFLFSPRYAREHPDKVDAWVKRASSGPADREISLARIDMIMAYDERARLGQLVQPTLVICGDHDFCTPLANSEELACLIPGSELAVMPGGGHFIHHEQDAEFFAIVRAFLVRN